MFSNIILVELVNQLMVDQTLVDERIIERIVYLREVQHMSFRKIAAQLKKENLTNLSKSTVAKIYHDYVARSKKAEKKKAVSDKKYRALSRKELRLRKEVDQLQMLKEKRNNIKELYLEMAKTTDGVKDIFNSRGKMRDFILSTCNHENPKVENDRILRNFISYCKDRDLPLAKTLFEAVGTLEEYKADAADGIYVGLDNYIIRQLESFLMEERLAMLQREFEQALLKAECEECGSSLGQSFVLNDGCHEYTFMLIEGRVRCHQCDASYDLKCVSCGELLTYKGELRFQCVSCNLTFQAGKTSSRRDGIEVKINFESN